MGLLAFSVLYARGSILVVVLEFSILLLIFLLGAANYWAYIFGHYVLIGPTQFPHLHKMVNDGAAAIQLRRVPKAFVYNANGLMNAFAIRLLGGPYVMLTASLIDADTDAQARFVIGHELGHHAAGHLNFRTNLFRWPGHMVPFLGAADSHARERTCDRVGAHLSGDTAASRGALQMLACGSARLNAVMKSDAFKAPLIKSP